MTSIDSLEVPPSTAFRPRIQQQKKFIVDRTRCATSYDYSCDQTLLMNEKTDSTLTNKLRLVRSGNSVSSRSSSCRLLSIVAFDSSNPVAKEMFVSKTSQHFIQNTASSCAMVWDSAESLTERLSVVFKNKPLKVTRPEFWRARYATGEVDTKKNDFQSKKSTGSSEDDSPPASSKFIQTQVSQSQALKELLNKDLTQRVVVPIRCLLRPRLRTTGDLGQNSLSEAVRTRSILVKKDQSSRDISRLNDSCSPKKKVAFAKNKMVLLFTKDS